jgi:hypothetical protein
MTESELDAMMQTEEIEPEDAIEKKGFMFMKSYLESYEILKKGDCEELANQLLKAIVYYGVRHEELEVDYRVESIMASIKRTIDKGLDNYKKRVQRSREKEKEKTQGKIFGRR